MWHRLDDVLKSDRGREFLANLAVAILLGELSTSFVRELADGDGVDGGCCSGGGGRSETGAALGKWCSESVACDCEIKGVWKRVLGVRR